MEAILDLVSIDATGLDPRIKDCAFTIASDVQSPLCGPTGASAIFGPQKGATTEMIELLDAALAQFAKVITSQGGKNTLEIPGAGAAGGMGAALLAFLNASVQSGIGLAIKVMKLEEDIKDADLIITGEGQLDHQTLSGKVIAGVCDLAKKYDIPVIALCGKNALSGKQMDELGLLAGFSIVPGPCTLQEAFGHTQKWATEQTEQILRIALNRNVT